MEPINYKQIYIIHFLNHSGLVYTTRLAKSNTMVAHYDYIINNYKISDKNIHKTYEFLIKHLIWS